MIDKYEILNNNFKYFLIIPYIFWLSLIVFYIFNSDLIKAGQLVDGIVYYGSDSYSYIDDAKKFLNFDFSKLHTSKLSYIFLITFIFFFNFSLKTLVLLQLFTTIISSFCLYLIGKKLFSKWVGLLCLFFFLTYAPMQIRNFFILTEILFINLSIILIYLCFFKQNQKILIFLISLFVLFLRPQGFLIILSLFFTFIIFKKQNGIYDFMVKIILMFMSFFLLIFFINIGIQDYELINSLSRGVIWGYSFDTNSICLQNCIQGFTNPDLYEKNIFEFLLYVKDNFLILTKVAFFKIILFFSGWRPYYSNLHNIFVMCFHLPIFILFCTYFFKFKKLYPFEAFSVFYIGLNVLFISSTFVDWSGRFIMYILPFMMVFASKSSINLISFFTHRFKNNH
jgi:hypothetical protein